VALAAQKGLAALALTDHDTLTGLCEAQHTAEEYGVTFVPGIEISAQYSGMELHLLGLFIDWQSQPLADTLKRLHATRCERNAELLARLNSFGVHINMGHIEALTISKNAIITRSHFARAIAAAGYCSTPQKAFVKYLLPGTPTYAERHDISPAEAISAIESAGGISILAHPLRYGIDIREIGPIIDYLLFEGLQGLECYYSNHSLQEQEELIRVAKKYRLCVSGGSDFHGFHEDIQLGIGYGNLYVPTFVYDKLYLHKQRLPLTDSQT